jgi:hypothetical protein
MSLIEFSMGMYLCWFLLYLFLVVSGLYVRFLHEMTVELCFGRGRLVVSRQPTPPKYITN